MRATIVLIIFIYGCNSKNETTPNAQNISTKKESQRVIDSSLAKNDSNEYFLEQQNKNWQSNFNLEHDIDKDSIWKKPVRYYVTDKNCDSTAINFYWGKFRPTDEERTAKLLSLVTTNNNKLRPFYRWILNKTIFIQDGALGEYTGEPARRYAEKFPKEFFEYMDIDSTGEKYEEWIGSISYSGFYKEKNYDKPELVRNNIFKTMYSNCKNCDEVTLQRIKAFAKDCFPNQD